MKFVLGKSSSIWWPVTVQRPDPENPGQTVKSKLQALLVPQPQDAFLAAQEEIGKVRGLRAQATAEREYLATRIEGWEWPDATDDEGRSVGMTPATLALALQEGWFRKGLWRALNEIGLGEPAEGN